MSEHKRKTDLNSKNLYRYAENNMHRLLLIMSIFVFIVIAVTAAPKSHNIINSESNAVFAIPWQYSLDGKDFQESELPIIIDTSPNNKTILKNKIPREIVKGATILIRTSQQHVEVHIDGEAIYSSFDNNKSPSSAYHFIRLPNHAGGEEITVALSSPYSNFAGFLNQIYIGSKASNIFFIIHQNVLPFVIGFLVSSLGFLLLILFLLSKGDEKKNPNIYLGGLFVFAGYWVVAESKLLQFIIPYPLAITNTSIFALFLLPVFLGLYYYNSQTKVLKKSWAFAIAIMAMTSFLIGIMSCVNPALPIYIFPYYLVFVAIYLIALFASVIRESIKAGKLFTASVLGVIAFSACCLIELILYLANIRAHNNSQFLIGGLLLFCIAMVSDSIQNFTKLYQAAIKVDTLTVLAYIDGLTELKNRSAFLENMSNIDLSQESMISVAMFDVNNLKVVNDTLGHLVGDALLRHSAKVIKNSLRSNDEIYRIGGDEFVSIIHHDSKLDMQSIEHRIEEILKKENLKPLSYNLSIAYGFATFSKDIDKNLFETLERADQKMYICKKTQKTNLSMQGVIHKKQKF